MEAKTRKKKQCNYNKLKGFVGNKKVTLRSFHLFPTIKNQSSIEKVLVETRYKIS
jgi:hypothetical protein